MIIENNNKEEEDFGNGKQSEIIKIKCALNDSTRNIENKYIVMDWIDGKSMKSFSTKKLGNPSLFQSEKDLLGMKLNFLNQLKQIHEMNILHRDIKPANLMFQEINNRLCFFIIDFGISYEIEGENKI